MTYRGRVRNGVITLDKPAALAEGTAVSVRAIKGATKPTQKKKAKKIPTLYERMKPIIGKAVGLPPDASRNHDHYLYGTPKRER